MARTYDCVVEDDKGRPIAEAWCRAYNITDPANPVLVETQYTSGTGTASFTALPDDAPVDIIAIWGLQVKYYRNVFSTSGASIETAEGQAHDQNTDLYAQGIRTGTSFPATPGDGEIFFRTDLGKLYMYEA